MARKIVHIESISTGKYQGKNDDDIFVGQDYVAVIDGVSHKSAIITAQGEVKIAHIITNAIKKIDGDTAPEFGKKLNFDEFVRYINWYIRKYLESKSLISFNGELEATGVVYSKHFNQIWMIGDCRAVADGRQYSNPLKIDDVYIDIRVEIVKALLRAGYNPDLLQYENISKKIIQNPKKLSSFISNPEERKKLEEYRSQRIKQALIECGFTEEEILKQDLITRFYNPRKLQEVLKNNPNMGEYGYAIFNGNYTEQKNCRVIQLPSNVKTIKLFTDGFPIDAFDRDRDISFALDATRQKAKKDPLSIGENKATHPAKLYSVRGSEKAIDDASAVIIEIQQEREKDDDERG